MSSHHSRQVGGGGASAFLLPGTTSGFSPPAQLGSGEEGVDLEILGPVSLRWVCFCSIRRRDGSAIAIPSALKEQRSAAALDQSPRCSSPWQLQHQERPRGTFPAKSHPPGGKH